MKLYGFEQRVFNNYFFGLTGRRHEAPFALVPGTLDTPTTDKIGAKYDDMTSSAPTRCWIAYNTWVDCAPLGFGFKPENERPCIPNENTFVNNLVVHTKPRATPLVTLEVVRGLKASGNLGYTGNAATAGEWQRWFKFEEPALRQNAGKPGIWRLTAQSPAIGAASADPNRIIEDIFGRPRPANRHDIGAEQFSDVAETRRTAYAPRCWPHGSVSKRA